PVVGGGGAQRAFSPCGVAPSPGRPPPPASKRGRSWSGTTLQPTPQTCSTYCQPSLISPLVSARPSASATAVGTCASIMRSTCCCPPIRRQAHGLSSRISNGPAPFSSATCKSSTYAFPTGLLCG